MRNKSKSRPDHSNVDWRNAEKTGESFRKFNFYRARLEFSKLVNCDFSAVSAKHACFIKADLSGSNFTGANLEGSNFGGANLTGVNFKSAVLNRANFEGAIIDGANFVSASVKGARKLALSETQLREIEDAKQAQKEINAAARLVRQSQKNTDQGES
jgi:uncharacterized protein YjbI with pentapeptide repeats